MAGISELAKRSKLKVNDVRQVFAAIGDIVKGGDKVTIKGFGTFKVSKRQARSYSTPILGTFDVAAHYTTAFRPHESLRMMKVADIEGQPKLKKKVKPSASARTGSSLKKKSIKTDMEDHDDQG
jgi:nucleoid DNA-binding protein